MTAASLDVVPYLMFELSINGCTLGLGFLHPGELTEAGMIGGQGGGLARWLSPRTKDRAQAFGRGAQLRPHGVHTTLRGSP